MTSRKMGGRQYQRAKAELNARGDIQACWSCGKTLYTEVTYPHPNSITLGHYTAREDGGALYDPNNYGPQCMTCNYGDGARRTNNKLGNPHRSQQQRLSTTNDNW